MKRLVSGKQILVCVGPGGVGKTTAAAALGVLAARQGRRTLVCTIDPAPRLADALGVPDLGPEPRSLADETNRILGIGQSGTLQAARVDTGCAFDRLVGEQVADPVLRARILANPLYRQMTADLTGAPEYAATLFLFDLQRSRAYDLIVLDTPPTANALDFLATPRRLADAISSPALQWLAARSPKVRRFSLQRLSAGGALVLRRAGKLVGSQFLDDLGAFLLDVRDVLGAFLAPATSKPCCGARKWAFCSCCHPRPRPSTKPCTSPAICEERARPWQALWPTVCWPFPAWSKPMPCVQPLPRCRPWQT
jgi:anion-transporting  ArsA/GET3 family ATPase